MNSGKAIITGVVVGLVVYVITKLIGFQTSSSIVGAISGAVAAVLLSNKKKTPKE